MYKLENDVEWTEELKDAFKHGVTRGKITFDNTEINYDNGLKDIEIQDAKYVPKMGFIGQATSRKATINLIDKFQDINLENKEIEIFIGADYNGSTYYINYGKFIVNGSPQNDSTNNTIKIIAYDYMMKFNKDYIDTMPYPCTLKQLLESVCEKAGVELGTQTFANDTFSVTDNQFDGKTLREILQNIAKCAFSWARIGQDNKLYLDFDIIPETTEVITIDDYMQDNYKKANEYYGPVNRVTYAETNITGQEESVPEEDSEDIIQNGLKELVIYDNLFAYTTEKRHALIQAGERLLGLEYMPIQDLKCVGLIYLDCNDAIEVYDEQGNSITSRLFSHIIRYNGAVNDNIATEASSNNEQIYKNKNSPILQNNRIEIVVDRATKQITSIVEEIGDRSQKTTTITQDIDGIESAVQDIEDLTNVVSGIKSVSITDAYPNNDILELHIYGNNSVFSYLYPRNDLYPSSTLYPHGDSKVKLTNSQGTTIIDLGIIEVLRQNAEVRDEAIIDYLGNISVIRRVNKDGTTKSNPTTTQLGQAHFTLEEGTNTFEIVTYSAPIEVKYAMKTAFTEIFATRTEMSSEIKQTAQSINLSVNQKLSNYSTTTEMYSAITLTATEINSVVATKVGNDEVISKINQSAERVQIEADKISLAGKLINLTSDNIVIASTNFNVDKNGNITCSNANITGKVTATSGKIAGYTINGNQLIGNSVGLSGLSGEGWAFWAGSNTAGSAPFRVGHDGSLIATSADISGTITATSGTFQNCTITNSCSVPASTVSGTLASNNIPNLSASKITSGTMSGSRISGGTISGSNVDGVSISGDIITVNSVYGHYDIGNETGQNYNLIVQQEGQYWRRLRFVGGILIGIDENW